MQLKLVRTSRYSQFRFWQVAVCAALSLLVGCAFNPFQKAPVREPAAAPVVLAPAAPTVLTAEAAIALANATKSVADARAARTLWTASVEKLAAAMQAAAVFDSATTIALSREVEALCGRSALQATLPLVTW